MSEQKYPRLGSTGTLWFVQFKKDGPEWYMPDKQTAEQCAAAAEAFALLREVTACADAGDPKDGCWEDENTGERIWMATIDDTLRHKMDALLASVQGER
jgi:hypothetical protein